MMQGMTGSEVLRQRPVAPLSSESLVRQPGERPRLLVSVRSLEEAKTAIEGGADILDLKEPTRGSLGMAGIADIQAVAKLSTVETDAIPLSVALGELVDWRDESAVPVLPKGIRYAKLGLSRCALDSQWQTAWQRIRNQFQSRAGSQLNWVAVCYADSDEAAAPGLKEVIHAARDASCAGLLIDTWTKDNRSLLDHFDVEKLAGVAKECHSVGMFLALAGRLKRESLPVVAPIPCDVIAIRSAACSGTDRTSAVNATQIADFRRNLHSCFSHR